MDPHVSVVVPVHNEAPNLDPLTGEIRSALRSFSFEIILVDDGSEDETPVVLASLESRFQEVRVLTLRRNFGQTAALAAGFAAARGEIIATLDADLQNDPSVLPELIARLDDGFDLVSGIRADRKDNYLTRTLPSRLANALTTFVTGVPIRDLGCSLKVYRREILRDIRLYGELHRFLPALVGWAGGRITEMNVPHRPRRHGESHYPALGRTGSVLLDLMVVKFLFSYDTKPIQLFGRIALYSFLGSAAAMSFVVYRRVFLAGEWLSPLFFLAIFLFAFSIQFLLLGLLADLLVRTYHESQGKPIYQLRPRDTSRVPTSGNATS
jgi:glycosyltransferase involved in cell wall biosynthesis